MYSGAVSISYAQRYVLCTNVLICTNYFGIYYCKNSLGFTETRFIVKY